MSVLYAKLLVKVGPVMMFSSKLFKHLYSGYFQKHVYDGLLLLFVVVLSTDQFLSNFCLLFFRIRMHAALDQLNQAWETYRLEDFGFNFFDLFVILFQTVAPFVSINLQ